ncbi:cocaine esterase-like [Mytilus californianus]|uniref:cocaine esterase-like n=1 Tax=Mytilus californianus TaxID=6549 RepID=UPI00224747D3|nr:cocaine esterase-like [Mytilus californianus]XP_052068049.1 cocaine esterase-like [Mytilus californianus]
MRKCQKNKMNAFIFAVLMTLVCVNFATGDLTVVNSVSGPIKGLKTQNKQTGKDVYEFRGIPFGKPPIGPLRFKKPEPADKWTDTLDATEFGAACPQSTPDMMLDFKPPKMSEDCLFLNVYVPTHVDKNRILPVMVWIYGGGLVVGFSNQYDGGWIATQGDVIVVTINYRLDIFGFFKVNHPSSKGNYGLWDQKLALQWVHDNIASFGGDPESVTIFGESAGGWSVSFQSLIPQNKGLFQRAISQSGVVNDLTMLTKKQINERTIDLAKKTSCPINDMYKFTDCLRDKDVSELLKATDMFSFMPEDRMEVFQPQYLPVVDGELFQDHPLRSLKDKKSDVAQFFGSLDFIAGFTSNEGLMIGMEIPPKVQEHFDFNATESIPLRFICKGMIDPFVEKFYKNDSDVKEKLCKFYTTENSPDEQSMRANDFMADCMFGHTVKRMLNYHASFGGRTYQYLFSKEKPFMGDAPKWGKGSGHGEELQFMFDAEVLLPSFNVSLDTLEDQLFANALIGYWTSFARKGEPEGAVVWKPFDTTSKYYLDLDTVTTLKSDLKPEVMNFWLKDMPPIELDPVDDMNVHDEL